MNQQALSKPLPDKWTELTKKPRWSSEPVNLRNPFPQEWITEKEKSNLGKCYLMSVENHSWWMKQTQLENQSWKMNQIDQENHWWSSE